MKKIFFRLSSIFLALILILGPKSFAEGNKKNPNWDEEIIYMIMTDRFFDGDESNNNPANVEGSFDKDHLEAYHGGDFKGIIEKIPYLKELGITTLWITPIVKNIDSNMMADKAGKQFAYHGYWAEDFTKLDPHLGSEDDFKELIDALHYNGIKLMVDVVINHSGYGTKNQGPFAGLHREKSGAGDIETELAGLPDFKTEDKSVRDKIIAWQVDWLKNIKTAKGGGIDYFRVDTVKHVDKDTMKDFKAEARKAKLDIKMIGENFGASVFKDGGYLDPSMMDSLLDFDFKDLAKDFVRGKISETESKLARRNAEISQERQMGQFLSSHDEDGFLKVRLGGDVGKFLVASSLQLTAKGQPVIYYGEEIGQSGKKDKIDKGIFSENRYDFDWSKTENNPILDHYQKLIAIRKAYPEIFARGDRKGLYMDDTVSVFARSLGEDELIIGLNTSDEEKTISFDLKSDENLYDLYNQKKVKLSGNKVTLKIPSRDNGGTAILANESSLPEDLKTKSSFEPNLYWLLGLGLIIFILIYILRRKKAK
ncbi:alpha-amylase family glycosyl hydrolase [uncultured Anaerococcus sp.]|uniref:alpha-amylase family glycosyl hydrolase n=1 Tax=uncultured Anaerococcus sp. TaxID=293428 RepID=UPI00260CCFA9|nr:alpha-amylase family glycosyl hydrolase [uncultured Anaerococcus sp.]